ncbi:unnamed protein product [Symbiodinium pilosum]|uniref:Uncharacterized protein n=1 Tax=Symbiodinium pilosum TaxID=2952 RepID=A0A812R7Y6_SYMPI|nr:unnamed protein product [Symbiodinium pilosum]
MGSSAISERRLLFLLGGCLALLHGPCCVPFSRFTVPPARGTHGREVKRLYHVTAHGEAIQKDGFMIPGDTGTVGGGIYFAETEFAARSKATSTGYVVVADVHVGKAMTVDQANSNQLPWNAQGMNGWLIAFFLFALVALVILGALWIQEMITGTENLDIMDIMEASPHLESWTGNDWASCFRTLQEAGYDSIYSTGFDTGPEYVVFSMDQVQIVEVRRM